MASIFADFEHIVMPGITHWQHPNFYAYFPANASGPAVLAEMLAAGLAVNCMLWQTSPAGTEMETRVLEWLRDAMGLPREWAGSIQTTASEATLTALLAARERALDWRGNRAGLSGAPRFTVYCSEEAHSSVDKAVAIAGFGLDNLRKIPVDEHYALRPEVLEHAIANDLAAGAKPLAAVATLGSTGVGGMDPLRAMGEICRRHGLWLHADAAWAGNALLLPEYRSMVDGAELADSFVFNPHKWLLTNFDCSAFYVRDRRTLTRTFEINPEYLKTPEGSEAINYRDWGIPLGRRFRALKLWFVLRAFGLEGLRHQLRQHIAWTARVAGLVGNDARFEITTPPVLALFTFRLRPKEMEEGKELDELNARLLAALNNSGKAYFTQTRARGRYVIRWCIGSPQTEWRHLEDTWRLIQAAAHSL
jgi:aromatic-L-amino-acid decarboxylase